MSIGELLDHLRDLDLRVFRMMWNRIRQFWTTEKWIRVTDDEGESIVVDARGALSAVPTLLDGEPIAGWAGPWPLREHRWDPNRARAGHRLLLI